MRNFMLNIPTSILQSTPQSPAKMQPMSQSRKVAGTRYLNEHSTPVTNDKVVLLGELSNLHRREFKIQGA